MMIQSMRSGTMVQSGKIAGCIGCHEDRRTTPPVTRLTMAARRAPSRLDGWYGPPREFSYLRDVQPVFDKHCVSCHDFGQEGSQQLNLAPDRDLVFSVSYNELWRKQHIQVVGAGPAEIQPAYSWDSHASKLAQTLLQERGKTQLTPGEFERVVTWIDINAPYYPSYASAYPDRLAGRSPLEGPQLARLEQLTGVPLRQLVGHRANQGPQMSFDRPESSPCLQQLTDPASPEYREAVAIIRAGRELLPVRPAADSEAFQACSIDQWRDEKYLAPQEIEQRNRAALEQAQRRYDREDGLPK